MNSSYIRLLPNGLTLCNWIIISGKRQCFFSVFQTNIVWPFENQKQSAILFHIPRTATSPEQINFIYRSIYWLYCQNAERNYILIKASNIKNFIKTDAIKLSSCCWYPIASGLVFNRTLTGWWQFHTNHLPPSVVHEMKCHAHVEMTTW